MTGPRQVPVIDQLAGGLVASCQALPGDPLDDVRSLVALARSAAIGGAVGLRIAGPSVVAAVREACDLPIIGITKRSDRDKAYITPTLEDAQLLVAAGASVVAVEATDRARPSGLSGAEFVRLLVRELDVAIMADVSTMREGEQAFAAGATLVATTLSGYTPYSNSVDGPDIGLVRSLAPCGRVLAEGRIQTPEQLEAAFDAGAYAVVVGRAITRPQDIAARFAKRTPRFWHATTATELAAHDLRAQARMPRRPRLRVTDRATEPTFWLGVDGGQTALRAVIIASDGSVYGRGTAEPATRVHGTQGITALAGSLEHAVSAAMAEGTVPIRGAFLGLSGVVPGGATERAVRAAARVVAPAAGLCVDTDLAAARAGAFALRPGLVAVAGSGSAVLGEDLHGSTARAGGWGYLFGDEAGAFGIGSAAIRGILAAVDAGRPAPTLAVSVAAALGLPDVTDAPRQFYAGRIGRRKIAELAVLVEDAARRGDEFARAIFTNAGHVLAGQLRQITARLRWNEAPVPWAGVGGVFTGGPVLADAIAADLDQQSEPRLVRVEPQFPPDVGAALLAIKASRAADVAAVTEGLLRQRQALAPPPAATG